MNTRVNNAGDAELQWPGLAGPFDTALRTAVQDVQVYGDPVGIVAGGSIVRGQGGPTSDIDLYVIHHASFRQRWQRRYNGVPFEIFINPPYQVRRYFVEEHPTRPITAHLLATGFVVLDRDPVVQTLRNEAANWLATPPDPTPDDLRWRRYTIADLLDNARDVVAVDSAAADLLLFDALQQLIHYRFLAANQHLPRVKAQMTALRTLDEPAAGVAGAAIAAGSSVERLAHLEALAMQVTGSSGFFEWDSAVEVV